MNYTLWIGVKFLRSKKRQGAISLVTALSIAGVSVGVVALVVVLSVMTGFAETLKEKILGLTPHVVVLGKGGEIDRPDELLRELEEYPGVLAASPFVAREVILQGPSRAAGALVRGVDVVTAERVLPLKRVIKEVELKDLEKVSPEGAPGIVVGKELLRYLGCGIGDHVVMVVPLRTVTPWGSLPKWKRFEVRGVLDSGHWEFDFKVACVALRVAQEVFETGERITGIELRVKDIYKAAQIRRSINDSALSSNYLAEDWMERNRNLLFALKMEKKAMFVILLCVVAVAGLLIISILAMLAIEKKKDIAILKAMGATSRDIMRIFLFQGLLLGALGSMLGTLGGVAISWNLDAIFKKLEQITGVRFLSPEGYGLYELPSRVNPWDLGAIVACTLLISVVSALYPSQKASRLDPVEALRYE